MINNCEIIKYLLEFGFKEDKIEDILKGYFIATFNSETLLFNIKAINIFLLEMGYTKLEIIGIVERFPVLYSYGVNNLEQKFNGMIELGYTKESILNMTKKSRNLYSYSIDNLKKKVEDLIKLGYSKDEVLKLTVSLPELFGYSIENITQRIDDLINLGYGSKEEILNMTRIHIKIYSYSIENIKTRIFDLMELGFSYEEVIGMTKKYPNLFGLSLENIKEKIEYLRYIQLGDIILVKPKMLIQGVELTYARYEFYKSMNIDITMDNYRLLFLSEKAFVKRFGITKQELSILYPYKYNKDGIKYTKKLT